LSSASTYECPKFPLLPKNYIVSTAKASLLHDWLQNKPIEIYDLKPILEEFTKARREEK
jgi:hypothetical protein